jgi:hypothetical protein
MKIINGISRYEVNEANFEALRLALNYMGEKLPAEYFHGIAGTAFRIGGICPCAPTCTLAMQPQQLIELLGYDYAECPYDDANKDASLNQLTDAVCASIDQGIPVLVWNAFTTCEWDLVTGYDENEKVFCGRGSYMGNAGDYAKSPWNRSLEQAGLTGLTALVIKRGAGVLDRRKAEMDAIKEAVRHANDRENTDKLGGSQWVFLQGKAAYQRWADDFSRADHARSVGDAYCIGIYSSCHALAGAFLRGIAPEYPDVSGLLTEASHLFNKEAGCLEKLVPLLGWSSPETDELRNEKAAALLRETAGFYSSAIDLLGTAVEKMI